MSDMCGLTIIVTGTDPEKFYSALAIASAHAIGCYMKAPESGGSP